jgi:hypothetical protein
LAGDKQESDLDLSESECGFRSIWNSYQDMYRSV